MGFDNGFAVVAFTFTAVAAWGLAAPRILGRRSKFKVPSHTRISLAVLTIGPSYPDPHPPVLIARADRLFWIQPP
jgi:hypothetical protein